MSFFVLPKNLMNNLNPTNYRGSIENYLAVLEQIRNRWGDDEAKKYDPKRNARTYNAWREAGFRVKRGETALKSITFIPVEDKSGETVNVYKKTVNLFYYLQLEKTIS